MVSTIPKPPLLYNFFTLLNTLIVTGRAECQCGGLKLTGNNAIAFPRNGLKVLVEANVERIVSVLESDMALATYLYFEETYNNINATKEATQGAQNPQIFTFNPQTIVQNAKSKPTVLSEETTSTPEGLVTRKVNLALTSFCPMDFHKYPFDGQHCEINLQSFSYGASQVEYKWNPTSLDIVISTASSTLKLVGMRHWEGNVTKRNSTFSCLKIKLEFRRDLQYYLFQNLIPAFMMVAASWSVLWIDPDSVA